MNKVYHGFSHSSGVYKITNIENGDVYFGQASQLATRAMQHEGKLIAGAEGRLNREGKPIKHGNKHLQAAWNKYKSDAFEFEVIAVYPDKTERTAAEQALIDEHYGPGCYNMAPDATSGMSGRKHEQHTKDKISAAIKGIKHAPQTKDQKDAKSARQKGKKLPVETCEKMSAAAKAAALLRWAKYRAAKALLASTVLPPDSKLS